MRSALLPDSDRSTDTWTVRAHGDVLETVVLHEVAEAERNWIAAYRWLGGLNEERVRLHTENVSQPCVAPGRIFREGAN